jgi:hypothetical protein
MSKSSLSNIFNSKSERNVIIDPFSCLIKLSLLRFLDPGTKISIYQNRIHFNSPTYIQGFIRFIYGDNREHLHNLYMPIQKCVEWFWNDKNLDMNYVFNNSVIGLKMLKQSYSDYATIQHTIDYYIIILMQKNAFLINKIGINSLDIDKITDGMVEAVDKQERKDKIERNEKQDIIEQPKNKNKHRNTNTNNNTNSTLENTIIPIQNTQGTQSTQATQDKSDIKSDIKSDLESISQLHSSNSNNSNHSKDIYKFLFELWNQREINIVVNLYREMETKPNGYERDNIYSNIMSYCSMKENKLFKYIEENSSIL